MVHNGYLPERTLQTSIGKISVKMPKMHDHSGQRIKFNNALLPPYLKQTQALEEFIPWLYLKKVSTSDMQPALEALLGERAQGLSANTVSKLKQQWESKYNQ